jgi:hypothetical protein
LIRLCLPSLLETIGTEKTSIRQLCLNARAAQEE